MKINKDKTFYLNETFPVCKLHVSTFTNKNYTNGLLNIAIKYWDSKRERWCHYGGISSVINCDADTATLFLKEHDDKYDFIKSLLEDNQVAIRTDEVVTDKVIDETCGPYCVWTIDLNKLKTISAIYVITEKKKTTKNMCKYCTPYYGVDRHIFNDRKPSQKKDSYVGVEAYLEDDKLMILAVADTAETGVVEAAIPIKFCPICGRKLP